MEWIRFVGTMAVLCGCVALGWVGNGWRWQHQLDDAQNQFTSAVALSSGRAAAYADRIDRDSAIKEAALIRELEAQKGTVENLRAQLQAAELIKPPVQTRIQGVEPDRSPVRGTLAKPLHADGPVGCDRYDQLDWRVFQDIYNRAGSSTTVRNGDQPTTLGYGGVPNVIPLNWSRAVPDVGTGANGSPEDHPRGGNLPW